MTQNTSRRRRALERRFLAIHERLTASLARQLEQFFRDQAERVVQSYLILSGAKMSENEVLGDVERRRLELVILPAVTSEWLEAGDLAGDLVGGEDLVDTDIRLQSALSSAGARIQGILDETRRVVRETLTTGAERNYSPFEIARGVPKDDFRGLRAAVAETYRGRAETIARTEMAYASQAAAHDRYVEMGVAEVDIIDGAECGWTSHDDPDFANGSRRSVIEAQEYPIAHPNCIRISLPVLGR